MKVANLHRVSERKLLCLKITEIRYLLLRGELTYGDIAKGWVQVRQGDSRLVEVGGLTCEGDRIVPFSLLEYYNSPFP